MFFIFFSYFCLLLIPRYFHCLHLTGGRLVFELLSEGGTRSFLALPFPPTHEECGQWPPILELSTDIIFQGFSSLWNPKGVREAQESVFQSSPQRPKLYTQGETHLHHVSYPLFLPGWETCNPPVLAGFLLL